MSDIESFLTSKEEEEIIFAIRQAEQNTSGEIRVHLEKTCQKNHFDRAVEVFYDLKMFNTSARNAVLIYIAVHDHKFVIYGDKGIHNIVPKNFWDTTKNIMQQQFKNGKFKSGIIEGILQIGKELKLHFPWNKNDLDELPNKVSKG